MKNSLSNIKKKALKAKAHALKPSVIIGQHGLTEAVLAEIDVALNAHELIKVRIRGADKIKRTGLVKHLISRICQSAASLLLIIASSPSLHADLSASSIGAKYISDSKMVSNLHYLKDIEPVNKDGTINVVIEIPAGTNQKWEVSKKDGSIVWEFKKEKPRLINYINYPGNYGMIPGTLLPKEQGGDGDPLDAILLGPRAERGSVVSGKIIGKLNLSDGGEVDDKLILVQKNSPFFIVGNIEDLNNKFPGVSEILEIWFKNYKGKGKILTNGFGGLEESTAILDRSIESFK